MITTEARPQSDSGLAVVTTPEVTIEISPVAKVEAFIASHPPTLGTLDGGVHDKADGIYLTPSTTIESTTQELPRVVGINLLPGAQLGAGASHHGVMFGNVAVEEGGDSRVVKVAIKPFTTDSEAASHEHDCLLTARERGINSFVPLAVAKNGNTSYLLTRAQDEISSLDNEDWALSPGDPAYETTVVPALAKMATALAHMNSNGMFHGDAQIRNFAQSDTGDFLIIDFEDTTIVNDIEECARLLEQGDDVWHFWYAATHPMMETDNSKPLFLAEETYETCMHEFEVNFLDPYIAGLKSLAAPSLIAQLDLEGFRERQIRRTQMST